MSLRWWALDGGRYSFLYLVIEQKTDQNGQPRISPDGVPESTVTAFAQDASSGGSDTVKVTVPTADHPRVVPGQPVHFENLRVMHWENNGRSGLAWRADSMRPAEKGRATASEQNG